MKLITALWIPFNSIIYAFSRGSFIYCTYYFLHPTVMPTFRNKFGNITKYVHYCIYLAIRQGFSLSKMPK